MVTNNEEPMCASPYNKVLAVSGGLHHGGISWERTAQEKARAATMEATHGMEPRQKQPEKSMSMLCTGYAGQEVVRAEERGKQERRGKREGRREAKRSEKGNR